MEHVVFFPASDATPAFRRVASLEEAVRLVEHLRNVEGVAQVSLHALSEVPLSFRTVIKVELPGAAVQPAPQPAPEPPPVPQQAPEPVAEAGPPVEPDLPPAAVPVQAAAGDARDELEPFGVPAVEGMDQLSAAGGRARSLGFFA